MTNSDDKNNNSNVNEHPNQTLNHRTVVGEGKNGKLQHKIITTDSIHDTVDPTFRPQLRWPDLIAQLFLHTGAIYGLVFQFYTIKFYTIIWCKSIDIILWKSKSFIRLVEQCDFFSFLCLFSIRSLCTYHWQWFWYYGRRTSSIFPQIIQSKCKVTNAFDILVYNFGTAWCIYMGTWSSGSSQIHG